jgi:hypothetical protein
MKNLSILLTTIAAFGVTTLSWAQTHDHDHDHDNDHDGVQLHVNSRWKECSFQLDPSLTQDAWHQFTGEAALVAYFRPLTDAKPLGAWHFEVAVLQWGTAIDDHDAAWNDTFVHPDSAHWLTESPRLSFPGLTARIGITDKIDLGFYFTKNINANYGFWGAQLQYNFLNNPETKWSASGRLNYSSLYGPEDLKLAVYGLDALVSKEFGIHSDWISVSPYIGASTFLASSHETTERVQLHDENVVSAQVMVGAVLNVSAARVGVEYNLAKVSTVSLKLGVAF